MESFKQLLPVAAWQVPWAKYMHVLVCLDDGRQPVMPAGHSATALDDDGRVKPTNRYLVLEVS